MNDEWQMHCELSGLIGAAMTLSRKPYEFATATWHAAGHAMITKRRIYDMVGCLLEAGPGHVFSTAIVTEQASVLPRCRHCRAMLAERGPQPVVGEDGLDACLSAIACSPSLRMSMTATLTVGTRGHEEPRPAGSRAGLWWTRWRRGGQSVAAVASSLMAVRAQDSSTMVFPAA